MGNEQFSFNRLKPGAFTDFRHFYTCNVSVTSEMLNKEDVKFDERFYKVNFEDIELAYRLSKNGMKILFKPDIFGYHYHEYMAEKFCLRQSTAGEMAVVFTQLHPEIDSILGVGNISEAYVKNKDTVKAEKKSVETSDIDKIINACNDLESELGEAADDQYKSYIKQILSILYEGSFRYKYQEGILNMKHPDEADSIDGFLCERYLGKPLRDALIAEYYASMDKNAGLVRLVFSNVSLKKKAVPSNIQANIKEVLNKVFGAGIEDPGVYAVNKQLIVNRVKMHLKKYYLIRKMKYKYDSIRRAIFLRSQ